MASAPKCSSSVVSSSSSVSETVLVASSCIGSGEESIETMPVRLERLFLVVMAREHRSSEEMSEIGDETSPWRSAAGKAAGGIGA